MKRFFTVLTVLVFTSSLLAQITITSSSGTDYTNGTYVKIGDDIDTNFYKVYLDVKQTSGSDLTVNVEKVETSVLAGTQNYFCWGLCLSSVDAGAQPTQVCPAPIDMDDNTIYSDFIAYHKSNGQLGESTYRYTFFSTEDPSVSSYVDVVFSISPEGVEELSNEANVNVYPNPARDIVNFEFSQPADNGTEVIIHNLLGKVIERIDVSNVKKTTHSLAGYEVGIYFYSVVSDTKEVLTKRLIVK